MTTESELHLPSAVLFFGGGGPAPASAAAAFSPVAESLAAALADLPNGELRVITVNGTALQVGFWDTPMQNRALLADLATSPLRDRVEASIVDGQAFASVAVVDGDIRPALTLLSQVCGSILEDTSADAIWLPEQSLVTTEAMFMHDLYEDQIERTWFRVHAMRIGGDSPDALAFTRGLRVLGNHELQVRLPGEPAELFTMLTEAVATCLRQERRLEPGSEIVLGGTTHRAVPGEDLVDEGVAVLDLVPSGDSAGAPEEPHKKKGWFSRR
ncbi:MAG TPA: hypothetical protein VIR30_11455 [Nocardioides sp.]